MDFGLTDRKLGSGTIWYPASGFRDGSGGSLHAVGYNGKGWSCSPNGNNADNLYFNSLGGVGPALDDGFRAYVYAVRCLRE